ncbi:hypothetical protein SUGI_0894610 [Cryptomeria japonica]|nr:hypothetical protein SUGI_0894610 [Cryptomeria japonica]
MGCIFSFLLRQSSAHVYDKEYGEQGSQFQHLCDVWRDIQGAHKWNGLLHPMDPIIKAEILRYGNLALSKLKFSGKRELLENMGMSECGYRVTKYIYANTGSLFGDKSKGRAVWFGFIAVCHYAKEIKRLGRRDIVAAWRGIQTTQEWIQDQGCSRAC